MFWTIVFALIVAWIILYVMPWIIALVVYISVKATPWLWRKIDMASIIAFIFAAMAIWLVLFTMKSI